MIHVRRADRNNRRNSPEDRNNRWNSPEDGNNPDRNNPDGNKQDENNPDGNKQGRNNGRNRIDGNSLEDAKALPPLAQMPSRKFRFPSRKINFTRIFYRTLLVLFTGLTVALVIWGYRSFH